MQVMGCDPYFTGSPGVAVRPAHNAAIESHQAVHGNVSLSPRLLSSSPISLHSSLQHCLPSARKGRAIIPGGQGSLGTLTAVWMQQQHLQQHVVLLGRNAHHVACNNSSHLFASAITATRCDAAVSEDIVYSFDNLGSSMVECVVFASGVLRDGLIWN